MILLALVVGGTAILPGRRLPWFLFAAACAVNAVGDTFNLVSLSTTASATTSALGSVFDGIAWPTAILLMSISVWAAGRDAATCWPAAGCPVSCCPGCGALAGLVILFVGTLTAA